MKYKSSPAVVIMQCTAALGVLALLMAWGTPIAIAVQKSCVKQVVCIASGESAQIGYFKGEIEHRSPTGGNAMVKGNRVVPGDSIETGANGFAWLKLASGRSYTIQPNSQTRFTSSRRCATPLAKRLEQTSLARPNRAAFLFAAVRG